MPACRVYRSTGRCERFQQSVWRVVGGDRDAQIDSPRRDVSSHIAINAGQISERLGNVVKVSQHVVVELAATVVKVQLDVKLGILLTFLPTFLTLKPLQGVPHIVRVARRFVDRLLVLPHGHRNL